MTYGKIVSLLAVSAFTFEQLWRVSGIHRNILKKRLEYLVKGGFILTHKFSIPYTKELYGRMYKYPVANPYTPPLYGYTYYLLNCSKSEYSGLVDFYYSNKATEVNPTKTASQKKGQQNRPKLCALQENMGEIVKELEQYDYDRLMKLDEKEFIEHWYKWIEFNICISRFRQENMIAAVKRGIRLDSKSEENISDVVRVAEFFVKKGYPKQDVLIRCSTDNIVIYTTRTTNGVLSASFMPYNAVWNTLGGI